MIASSSPIRLTSSGTGKGITMKTESELKLAGVRALIAALGPVDAERFIAALHREPFDYTRWRADQWQDATVAGLAEEARALRTHPNRGLASK
jgi:hypothetical protein